MDSGIVYLAGLPLLISLLWFFRWLWGVRERKRLRERLVPVVEIRNVYFDGVPIPYSEYTVEECVLKVKEPEKYEGKMSVETRIKWEVRDIEDRTELEDKIWRKVIWRG